MDPILAQISGMNAGKMPLEYLAYVFVLAIKNKCIARTVVPEITRVKNRELFEIMRWKIPYRFTSAKQIRNLNDEIHRLIVYSMEPVPPQKLAKNVAKNNEKIKIEINNQIETLTATRATAPAAEKKAIDEKIRIKKEVIARIDEDTVKYNIFEDRQKIGAVAKRVYKIFVADNTSAEILYNEVKLQLTPIRNDNEAVEREYILPNSKRDRKFDCSGNSVKSFAKKPSVDWKESLRGGKVSQSEPKYKMPVGTKQTDGPSKESVFVPSCLDKSSTATQPQQSTQPQEKPNKYVLPQKRPDYNKQESESASSKFTSLDKLTNFQDDFPVLAQKEPVSVKNVQSQGKLQDKLSKSEDDVKWDSDEGESETENKREDDVDTDKMTGEELLKYKCKQVAANSGGYKLMISTPDCSEIEMNNWGEYALSDGESVHSEPSKPKQKNVDKLSQDETSDSDDEVASPYRSTFGSQDSYVSSEKRTLESDLDEDDYFGYQPDLAAESFAIWMDSYDD